ncbi:MAG: site-specific DNA-methyltransferase [Sedimentisphaerales bacterium]|nr:site-specific DNA-methyltransferase [Sedimentisphaerales bacterium]
MATGIPKNGGNGKATQVYLTYTNKKATSEILQQTCPVFRQLYKQNTLNHLYFGNNLDVLRFLLEAQELAGQVELVYIDPPFATQSAFVSRKQKKAYSDTLTGGEFVEFLRERLIFLRELLSNQGSIYLHLDSKMMCEIKIVMDEIFGNNNYRNLIVRKKCNPKNYTRKTYGNIADFILFYTKTDEYIWNRPIGPLSEDSTKEYRYVEPETGRRFMKVPIHAPGIRNGETGKPWRGKMPPPGKHWQYTPMTLDKMDEKGEIFWSKHGNPRRKVYLDEHIGVGVQDIWLDFRDAHNQNIEITGYPTEKNPDLLRRIIEASSNPGGLVLDCFAGSGTTPAVANELGRNWIAADNSVEALKVILERFANGLQPMGDFTQTIRKNAQAYFFDFLKEAAYSSEELDNSDSPSVDNFSIWGAPDCDSEVLGIISNWIRTISAKVQVK